MLQVFQRKRDESDSGRTAVGAWVVATFQSAVSVKHHGSRMPHRIGIRLFEDRDVVADGQ